MCGYAVRLLRDRATAPVLDLLGILSPTRLAAIALALPKDRREAIVRRDPVWARALAEVDAAALADANRLADDLDAYARDFHREVGACFGPEYADQFAEIDQQVRRRDLGLPHDLSPEDAAKLAGSAHLRVVG